jgi:hypothetical protein
MVRGHINNSYFQLYILLATQTKESTHFRKYGESIADDLNMAYSTEADREEVFACLPEQRSHERSHDIPHCSNFSFMHQSEFPRMGSWLSWNRCASQQIPEFNTTKMLYEFHLGNRASDPDESALQFDQLEEAGTAATPQAQLKKLKEAGGGIPLAYKLMQAALLQLVTLLLRGV